MSEIRNRNDDQAAYWNDQAGRNWAALSELLDRQMEAVSRHTLDVLAPRPGERVLDVGCGAGRTTLQIAERVGATGLAMGLDISRPMLEIAERRAAAAGLAQARFTEADAQTHPFEPASYDAIHSRFGVMFFADPPAAFANLRRALKPGGRLAFLCWRAVAENPLMTTPMQAALPHLPPQPPQPPPSPDAPGPFAFADGERVRAILTQAGFSGIAVTPHDAPMGGNNLEDSVRVGLRIGPLGAILRQNPALAPTVEDAVRAALRPYLREDGVWQDTATWIVTARNEG